MTSSQKHRAADLRLRRTYGITLEEYERVLKFQKGKCAICKESPTKRRLAVDHDHRSGLVRGLLCMRCNRALGKFQDDTELVGNAYQYVLQPPFTTVFLKDRLTAPGRIGSKKRAKALRLLLTVPKSTARRV